MGSRPVKHQKKLKIHVETPRIVMEAVPSRKNTPIVTLSHLVILAPHFQQTQHNPPHFTYLVQVNPLSLPNPHYILTPTGLSIPQILQCGLDTAQSSGDNLHSVRFKPALCQP